MGIHGILYMILRWYMKLGSFLRSLPHSGRSPCALAFKPYSTSRNRGGRLPDTGGSPFASPFRSPPLTHSPQRSRDRVFPRRSPTISIVRCFRRSCVTRTRYLWGFFRKGECWCRVYVSNRSFGFSHCISVGIALNTPHIFGVGARPERGRPMPTRLFSA